MEVILIFLNMYFERKSCLYIWLDPMSWLRTKGAERHAESLVGTLCESTSWVDPWAWVDPMSRPLLLYRPKLQNSHFLFCATEVDPMSRLMSMSRPLWRENSAIASFQLVLAAFNAHLMCSNSSILAHITLYHYLKF